MGFLDVIRSWFQRLFERDPEAARRRAELKRLHGILAEFHPPYYRPKQNLVLPGFAASLFAFTAKLKPLAELVRATAGNPDARVAQRFFDHLIERRLPPEHRDRRDQFGYERLAERVSASFDPARELADITGEFQAFVRELESLDARKVNFELEGVERFVDICRHDYDRLLGFFDPGVSTAGGRAPDFSPVEGDRAAPELIDLYYLLEGFEMDAALSENLCRLLERRSGGEPDPGKRSKIEKLVAQLGVLLDGALAPGIVLALLRSVKGDPSFVPETPREHRDYFDSYRKRLKERFEKEGDRIRRERMESAVAEEIKALFKDGAILELSAYNDEMDSLLRTETPYSLAYIKPLRILKTFLAEMFSGQLHEALRRILVEGYFDNKAFQNNLVMVVDQLERSLAKIDEFETHMASNGRTSITALRRYVEELKRGRDIAPFVGRLVESIDSRARELVEGEAGVMVMLGEAILEMLADFRRSTPEVINNIRSIGGARNKEIYVTLSLGRDRISSLAKIMRNFAVVKGGSPALVGQPVEPQPESLADSLMPAEEAVERKGPMRRGAAQGAAQGAALERKPGGVAAPGAAPLGVPPEEEEAEDVEELDED